MCNNITVKTKTTIMDTSAAQVGDAVGLSGPNHPARHWYIAIVNNNTEKVCGERLRKLFDEYARKEGRRLQAYVPIQREMRVWRNGRRSEIDRVILPTYVFVYCTELERRKEIAYIPYIKRFFINPAGAPVNGHRPVAVIPDRQMADLRRMVEEADAPVSFEARPLHVGERVRVNGGKLVGLTGNVLREADGTTSLLVGIDILGYAKVSIQRDLLDAIGG